MVPRQIVVGYVPFGTVPQRRVAPLTLLREDVFDFVQVSRRAAEEIGSLSILAVACDRCAQSSYLVKSVDCTGCTYCFGCVGLNKKDFHILNKPYDRSTYFAITSRLVRELGLG